jgi:predicted transcriptional regulator of viral defense system
MLSKDFIETTAVFTTRDYLENCGDTQANRNLLSRAVKAEKALKIRQGLYASNAGKYRDHIHSKYCIVRAADPKAILCYNSAYELFAGQHNIVTTITFFTSKHPRSFEFQGYEYRAFPFPKTSLKTKGYRQLDGTVVKGTTPEQTVIDSLTKPDRCVGIENVLRILSTLNTVNTKELIELVQKETSPVKARVGWVLEQKKETWHISNEDIAELHESLGQGPFYFTPDHVRASGAYDSKWHLYFPETRPAIEGWING